MSEYRAQKFHTDDLHYPDLGSAFDWLCCKGIFFQPIRSTTKIWVVHIISVEFLRLLLRRHFAKAQVATSQNVGRFLRLLKVIIFQTLMLSIAPISVTSIGQSYYFSS